MDRCLGLPPLSPTSEFKYGYGDDTEYEYYHPNTHEGRDLVARGFRLPEPNDFTYPSSNVHSSPPRPAPLRHSQYTIETPDGHLTLGSAGPLTNNLMNNIPDASTPPSFSKHIDREGARKLIGQSVTKPDTKDRSGSGGKRATFTGDDLVQIAQAVVDKAPFLEPHVERRGKAPTHKSPPIDM